MSAPQKSPSPAALALQQQAAQRPAPTRDMFGGRMIGGLGMPTQKAKDFKGTLVRLAAYLDPHRGALIVIVVTGAIGTVFSVLGPKILGLATTKIFEGFVAKSLRVPGAAIDFGYVSRILLGLGGLYIVASSFQYLMQYLMANVAQKTVYAMRREVEAKFDRLPLKFFDSRTRGEVMSRAVNDLDSISGTLQQTLTQLLTSALTLTGVIVMMFTISWILTLVTLLTLPLSIAVVARIAKRSQKFFMKQQIALGALNGHVAEMYGGHPIITAFGHERRSIATFDELNETYYDGAWRAQFVSGIIMPTMMFIGNLGYVLIAVIGGLLVTRRSLAIGDVQAFIQYGRQFSMPITQLSGITNTIQLTMVSAERVFELLDEPEETPDADAAPAIAAPRGAVQFDHVGFRYKEDVPLIDDMTLDIAPGQMIAIVGPTGAGKTTLVNLLMRFYDVNSGAIRVDGVDIRQLKRGELRRMFGMVLQDTWLFSGTIGDNIAYGRRNDASGRRGHRQGREGGPGGPLHPHAARQLRHAAQRSGEQPVRRPEAAADDRARVPRRPGDPDPRRSDQQRGHAHGSPHPGRHARADARAHHVRHRAPAFHDSQRRRDPDDGAWPHRGARHPHGAARGEGPLRRAVPQSVCRTGRAGGLTGVIAPIEAVAKNE